jgi:hypothetical protein
MNRTGFPRTCEEVLQGETSSSWIKTALAAAMEREPQEAIRDAELLAGVLIRREFDRQCERGEKEPECLAEALDLQVQFQEPRVIMPTRFESLLRHKPRMTEFDLTISFDRECLCREFPWLRIKDAAVDFVLLNADGCRKRHLEAFNIHVGDEKDRYRHERYFKGDRAIFHVCGTPAVTDVSEFIGIDYKLHPCMLGLFVNHYDGDWVPLGIKPLWEWCRPIHKTKSV